MNQPLPHRPVPDVFVPHSVPYVSISQLANLSRSGSGSPRPAHLSGLPDALAHEMHTYPQPGRGATLFIYGFSIMKSADQGTSEMRIKCNLGLQSGTPSFKRDTFWPSQGPERARADEQGRGTVTEAALRQHMPVCVPALILLLNSGSFAIVQLFDCSALWWWWWWGAAH